MNERPAVSLRGVAVPGLDGSISFDLAAGECVVLLDGNAERRTALLQIIAGGLSPRTGTVRAGTAAAIWHNDGMPEDEPVISTVRSLLEHVGSTADPHRLLEELGLAHRAEHEPWAMSLGERRRIAIATAFASPVPVVVLDEPERGLDAAALRWVAGRVQSALKLGQVVLIATHDAALADACGDFIIDDLAELAQ